MVDTERHRFIIGIGSQRAGSTLLHKILDECTPIFMHPVKELHYYDTLYNIRDVSVLKAYSMQQLDRELDRIINTKQHDYIDKRYKCYLRTNKILAKTPIQKVNYIDLFRPCLSSNKYLGEITPEYMILPEEGVAQMANDLGKDAKIILISRDPVDRFISAFKLLKNYNNPNYDSASFSYDLEHALETMPSWIEQQKQLNGYECALEKYKKYFENVLLLSFESMVADTEKLKTQLKEFLDIPLIEEKYQKVFNSKVNSIGETAMIEKNLIKKIIDALSL